MRSQFNPGPVGPLRTQRHAKPNRGMCTGSPGAHRFKTPGAEGSAGKKLRSRRDNTLKLNGMKKVFAANRHISASAPRCSNFFDAAFAIGVARAMVASVHLREPTSANVVRADLVRRAAASAHVKGFGCRPVTKGAAHAWAGVRKPPGKEPARGGQRGCLRRYGDLAAAARAAVVGSGPWRCRSRLSVSAFGLVVAPIAVRDSDDRGGECGVGRCIARASSQPVADQPAGSATV